MSLDHAARLAFARGALEGLSVGDALGEALSYQHANVRSRLDFSVFRAGSVRYTDDTAMALDIMEWLCSCRGLDEDALAWFFTRSFQNDPDRGYGRMARRILTRLSEGEDWRTVSVSAFGGGSFGNGSAMRVAPLGAYFSENMSEVVVMAAKSARITHAHPEGIAGAVAVATATAMAIRCRHMGANEAAVEIWKAVMESTPAGRTRQVLEMVRSFDGKSEPGAVAREVGCGYEISCQDTVPFAIWNACRCLSDFSEALISTVEVGGDCDTNAAIVGGIVSSYGTRACIPEEWLRVRERLPVG